ncbi:hypothetical protein SKAU_G00006550 [Synaphobranchus kaupii]|uniref:Uncharacterized protein n=1 Tax=Synaphobranchus kaupii TaxID=118154 RepID=A0A9Q1GB14_SYNKA|nr:hypothetical protein SKAU_G00006550 [Synaphobranchus kaupii]
MSVSRDGVVLTDGRLLASVSKLLLTDKLLPGPAEGTSPAHLTGSSSPTAAPASTLKKPVSEKHNRCSLQGFVTKQHWVKGQFLQ